MTTIDDLGFSLIRAGERCLEEWRLVRFLVLTESLQTLVSSLC